MRECAPELFCRQTDTEGADKCGMGSAERQKDRIQKPEFRRQKAKMETTDYADYSGYINSIAAMIVKIRKI